uniref:Putative ovule protein n=1 Tax=Solanum chacoense TaxID=4108 RepID=A0A0V0GXD2_SOLCH
MVMVGISFLEGTSMTGNLIAILAYCNNMTSLLSLMQPWTISNGKEPPKDAFTVRSCYTLLEKPAPIPLWPVEESRMRTFIPEMSCNMRLI